MNSGGGKKKGPFPERPRPTSKYREKWRRIGGPPKCEGAQIQLVELPAIGTDIPKKANYS